MFEGRRVWRGADFTDGGQWSFALTLNTLAELYAILAGEAIATPCLDRDATLIREELATGRGFAVVCGLSVERWTD